MIRSIVFLLSALPLLGQDSTLLILQKGGSSLGYYTATGEYLATVPVGPHPHEMVLSPDGRYLYCTDNGTMQIEQAGKGNNTMSMVDVAARIVAHVAAQAAPKRRPGPAKKARKARPARVKN